METPLRLPSSHRLYPRLIDLSLGRISGLLSALGEPQLRLPPTIHLAGTNGKGSTLAFLRSILEAHGKRVHAYTSPHLVSFNERFVVASEPASDEQLAKPSRLLANCSNNVTFFEAATAAAFLLFAERPADYTLLETGLGGRFDATNVVPKPLAAVITPISVDHTEHLGTGLSSIASEKAGIIKPGSKVVVAKQRAEALRGLRPALADADAFIYGRDWRLLGNHYRRPGLGIRLRPSLMGVHQYMNAAVAAAVADSVLKLPPSVIAEGITTAEWPGRLQRLAAEKNDLRELWVDGAHNQAAAQALAASLQEWEEKKTHLIVAMTGGRKSEDFLSAFRPLKPEIWAVAVPSVNCLEPREIAEAARSLGFKGRVAASVSAALSGIPAHAPSRVVICGSLYLVGSVLQEAAQAKAASAQARSSA